MFDINYYMKSNGLRRQILNAEMGGTAPNKLYEALEALRSRTPRVFNIETTNNCNMTCRMCPRTSLMKRPIEQLSGELYASVLSQMRPHAWKDVERFYNFVRAEYGIEEDHRHEDAFYFYSVSTCLTLHGYGEPLLDPDIVSRVRSCTDKGIPTYFSCVAANITVKRMEQLMDAGMGVIKFALDALSDERQKQIRGRHNNFSQSRETILRILDLKDNNPRFKTKIVLTMLSFSDEDADVEDQQAFMDMWSSYPVYAYVKSQDNRWYYKDSNKYQNRSHYERQYCEFPWTSLTVMSNGIVVPCTQDYDAEMNMGNIREQSLAEIWNGEHYARFRRAHIAGDLKGYKCRERCDIPKLCQRLQKQEQPNVFKSFTA